MQLTRAQHYTQRNGGTWRKARVNHRCDWKQHGLRCVNRIAAGEEYFDTGLALNPQKHTTYKCCDTCAREVIEV
jgi:hypothetical protein